MKLAKQAIVQWLRQYLKSGYDLAVLERTLLDNGYRKQDIDDAVRSIYGAEVKHVIHLSKTSVALIIAVICSSLLIAAGFLYFTQQPAELLDVSTEVLDSSLQPGQRLNFNVELSSLGSSRRYDVDVRYDIEKDGATLTFKEETIGLETSKSQRTFIDLPVDAEPGSYILRTLARYQDKVARAASSFTVYIQSEIATCTDNIQNQGEEGVDCGGPCSQCPSCHDNTLNQDEEGVDCGGICKPCSDCDDNDPCTQDIVVSSECKHEKISPCCGNSICEQGEECPADCPQDDPYPGSTVWEKLDAIKELARSDDYAAAARCDSFDENLHREKCLDNVAKQSNKHSYCEEIMDERTREECLISVAKGADDHGICEKISQDTRRDRCYMHFAKAGDDFSVCDKVTDYYLKQLCNSMKDMQAP